MNDDLPNNHLKNNDLDDWASELKQQSLAANVVDRDQLMFECGQAAGRQNVQQVNVTTSRGIWILRQGLIVACSVCFGALLMRGSQLFESDTGKTNHVVQETTSPLAKPSSAAEQTEQLKSLLSVEQMAAIRQGQILHASSNMIAVNSYQRSTDESPLVDDVSIFRAGMRNEWEFLQ